MKFEPIAIVGVSAIFPGDGGTAGFWRDIVGGRDLVGDVPEGYWSAKDYFDADPKAPDKVYAKRGAFLSATDFDSLAFGIPPQVLAETDSAQLLALVAAKRVLDQVEKAGPVDKSRTSVILGVTAAQKLAVEMNARIQRPKWAEAMREAGLSEPHVQAICDRISANYVPWRENTFPGLLGNVVAGRVANRLDLGGTNCVTDAACASSFAAIRMAVQELHLGQSDLALTGGVDTFNDPFMYMCFSKTPALSPTGDCRPFSDQADGTILGEGVGLFALKRLSDAERDGNTIYAVIRGLGTSSDGRAKSVYAPLPEGQARALRRAYEAAGYGPETVELVEAHGTGTVAGDQAEFEGLRQVFEAAPRSEEKSKQWCALGTVKSQIGHTKAAAGSAGLFKAAMALHHRILPPTIKVGKPHPKYGFENSPFYLNTRARPWIRSSGAHPRRASVSSFGFGGSNYHLALEEYQGPPRGSKLRALPSELLAFSAASPEALLPELDQALAATSLPALARTSQSSFDAQAPVRLALVAADLAALRESLGLAIARIKQNPRQDFELPTGVYYSATVLSSAEPVAYLFSGQGAQFIDMGAELAMAWEAARAVWDESAGLSGAPGELHERVFARPAFEDEARGAQLAELTRTEWAQPAIGAASLSILSLLDQLGLKPHCVAGHSFGELTALHAAGVLSRQDLLVAARKRGERMSEAASAQKAQGTMLAVMAGADVLQGWIRELKATDIGIANANSPRETVLAGSVASIEQFEKALRERGVESKRLQVATAFHSPWVAGACASFATDLAEQNWRKPELPVFSNRGGKRFDEAPQAIQAQICAQIGASVDFVQTIEAMYAFGARTFIEVGPTAVLTRMVGEILGSRPHRVIALGQRGRDACTPFWRGLGKLSVSGVRLDFSALWGEYDNQTEPVSKSATRFAISGYNFGKPKPEPMKPLELDHPLKKSARSSATMHDESQNSSPETLPQAAHTPQVIDSLRDPGLLGAFAEIHRSTAEAHAAYQRAMAESHAAFLRASEETLGRLAGYLSGTSVPSSGVQLVSGAQRTLVPRPAVLQAPAVSSFARPAQPSTLLAQPAAPQPVYAAPSPAPVVSPPKSAAPAPARPAPSPQVIVSSPSPTVAPSAIKAPAAGASAAPLDFKATLFDVVAEKTGYPSEMLKLEMELEADLGIDSIKRVEILSALKKKVPSLASATAQETAAMRSLAQIVAFTEKKSLQPTLI